MMEPCGALRTDGEEVFCTFHAAKRQGVTSTTVRRRAGQDELWEAGSVERGACERRWTASTRFVRLGLLLMRVGSVKADTP